MAKWIAFELSHVQPGSGNTKRWDVVTMGGEKEVGGIVLGTIQWRGGWRKYAFYPVADTLYEPNCLRDIAGFMDEQMQQRRADR